MAVSSARNVTQLLLAWSRGEDAALEELTPLDCQELRRFAHRYMGGERPTHTEQTTVLVNEAYLRLVDGGRVSWQDRARFLAVSARQALVVEPGQQGRGSE